MNYDNLSPALMSMVAWILAPNNWQQEMEKVHLRMMETTKRVAKNRMK